MAGVEEGGVGAVSALLAALQMDKVGEAGQQLERLRAACLGSEQEKAGGAVRVCVLEMLQAGQLEGEEGRLAGQIARLCGELGCSVVEEVMSCPAPALLGLVCHLAGELLTSPPHPATTTPRYWQTLQAGVASTEPRDRKRALFLLQRTQDCREVWTAADSDNLLLSPAGRPHLLSAALASLCLVLQTLEEKQAHLVKPVLSRLQQLAQVWAFFFCSVKYCVSQVSSAKVTDDRFLHCSWVLLAFLRVFHHPSQAVLRWGVETFLSLESDHLASFASDHLTAFICNPLLAALDQVCTICYQMMRIFCRPGCIPVAGCPSPPSSPPSSPAGCPAALARPGPCWLPCWAAAGRAHPWPGSGLACWGPRCRKIFRSGNAYK